MKNLFHQTFSLTVMLALCILLDVKVSAQNVGVGNNSPTEKLDVGGNVKFSGALMPNNLPGTAYTSLTSSGAAVAPIWQSATIGQSFTYVTGTNLVTLTKSSSLTTIPGLNMAAFTVPSTGTYDVWVYTDGMVDWFGTAGNNDANRSIYPEIQILIDNVEVKNQIIQLDNVINVSDNLRPWNVSYHGPLSAGSHTITVKGRIYKYSSWMNVNKTKVIFGAANYTFYNFPYLVAFLVKK